MWLAQVQSSDPTISAGLAAILIAIAIAIPILVEAFRRRFNIQSDKQENDLLSVKNVRIENLQLDNVPAAIIPDNLKIMYIGQDDADTGNMTSLFQTFGIKNRLLIHSSINQAMQDLTDHPGIVLFIIIYVENKAKGERFLDRVKTEDVTRDIPILFMDGFAESGVLELYQGGADAILTKPLDISALLTIITRLGYSSTFTKNKQGIKS